jgi:hypothetical protein
MDAHAASFVAQAAPFRAEVRAAWSEVVRARGGRARVLHVGFLSTGFGMHVRSHLSVHMFHELATRHATRVHTHCFALNGDDGTIARERIERYCNEFVVVEGLGDLEVCAGARARALGAAVVTRAAQIARTIAARGLDVFVEFNGYWYACGQRCFAVRRLTCCAHRQYRTLDPTPRVQIAAYRVAPVQMSILTWASTFGRGLLDVRPDARACAHTRLLVLTARRRSTLSATAWRWRQTSRGPALASASSSRPAPIR